MADKMKVLVIGWYGVTNIGDELLLEVMLQWLKESGAHAVIASLNPQYTRQRYGAESVDFHNLGEIARVVADCDLLVLGGGGIFQDHHPFSIHALYNPIASDISQYARPVYLARQFGVPTAIIAHGVGPLNTRNAQLVVKDVFSIADFVSLRDEQSLAWLRGVGVTREVCVAADPGWFATREFVPVPALPKVSEYGGGSKRLGLIIRPWSKVVGWEEKLISALSRQLPAGWQCVWFAFQRAIDESRAESDIRFLKHLAMGLDGRIESEFIDCTTVEDSVAAIAACDSVLSMRLHGSIVALASHVPSAFLEYDEKMAQAHDMAQVPAELRLDVTASEEAFASVIAKLVSNGPVWRMDSALLLALQESASRHRDILASAIRQSATRTRPLVNWVGGDFDWMGAWMEDLICQQRSVQAASERAHSLLEYRDFQLHELGQRCAALQEEIADLRRALDDESGRHASMSSAKVTLAAHNELLQAKVEESDSELIRSAAKIRSLEMEGARLLLQLRTREGEILEMGRDIEMLKDANKQKDSALAELEEHLASLARQVRSLETDVSAQRAYIDEKEVHVAQLSQEIDMLRAQAEAHCAYIAEKEVHVATLTQELQRKNRSFGVIMQDNFQTLSSKVRKAIYILQNGGPRALMSAWRRRQYVLEAMGAGTTGMMAVQPAPLAAAPAALKPIESFYEAAELQAGQFVVFSSLSFFAFGGLHRAAQMTKAALGVGRRAVYVTTAELETTPSDVAGLRMLRLCDLDISCFFAGLSERAVIVSFLLEPTVRSYFQYARNRGLATYLDLQEFELGQLVLNMVQLREFAPLVNRVCVAGKAMAERLADLPNASLMELPSAASHVYFDAYKQYPIPSEFSVKAQRRFLICVAGVFEAVDWKYLGCTAELNPDDAFYLLGVAPPDAMPRNVFPLPEAALANANAYAAHCDAVLVPMRADFFDADAASLGLHAGAFLNKYVVSSRELALPHLQNVLYAPDPIRLGDLQEQIGQIVNNDLFVSRNSWLSRVELLAPTGCRKDVSVVILIHNNARIIGRCLDTLLTHCADFVQEVIVVDNASSDGGAELVEKEFPQVTLVRNPENGCSSGRNLGVKHASGKYLAFFDSDQWFTGGAGFAEALSILERHADVGVIGWNAGWFDATRTDLGGMIADYCPNRAMNSSAIRRGYRTDIGFLGTSGFFMRRVTFDATDGFDTFYDPTCFEDTDLCFQIRALGMEVAYRDLSGIRHQPHQTTGANSGSDKYKALFLRNAEYFKKKWKDYPQFLVDYDFNAS